jgi:hypothetical protein
MTLFVPLPARFFLIPLIAGSFALAQQDDGVRGAQGTVVNGRTVSGSVLVAGPELLAPMGTGLVTGQPYSAEQISEHKQTLADGTHISQKQEMQLMYRDSQGRTRTERLMFRGPASQTAAKQPGLRLIHIYDPVAGYSYTLDPGKLVAHRFTIQPASDRPRPMRPTGQVAPQALAQRTPPIPKAPSLRDRELKSEPMGSKVIDGIAVEGDRLTITTPAGVEGNDRPMTRVCEHWRSEELKLTILSKCTDPRRGNTILRVRVLDRAEPDPELFQVPADYTVVDEEGPFVMGFKSSTLSAR